ncbi:MAG: DNA translocase FtsK 4TM domain-containing protein, partial [Anaerolineae bacterium]
MTKRSSGRGKKPDGLDIGGSLHPEILGILLLLLGLLTLLSLIPVERGAVMEGWITLLQRAVGWGVWLLPIGFGGVGLWLIFVGLGRDLAIEREKPVGAILLFLLALALAHLVAGGDSPRLLAADGLGGGYVGYWLSELLITALGTPAAVLVLVTLSMVSLMMLLGMSLGEMWGILTGVVRRVAGRGTLPEIRINRPRRPAAASALPEAAADEAAARSPGAEAPAQVRPAGSIFPRIIGGEQVWRLPNVADILVEAGEQELSQSEIRDRVHIIEETLASFGVPAKVVEVNQGPTVTQFGVEPGYVEKR